MGRHIPAADIDRAQFATAMRRESRAMAQMGNIDTGSQCRIHDGLPCIERDVLPVYEYGIWRDGICFCAHVCPSKLKNNLAPRRKGAKAQSLNKFSFCLSWRLRVFARV